MREWQKENADKDPLSNSLVSADEYASALQVRETLAPSIGKRKLFTVAWACVLCMFVVLC